MKPTTTKSSTEEFRDATEDAMTPVKK